MIINKVNKWILRTVMAEMELVCRTVLLRCCFQCVFLVRSYFIWVVSLVKRFIDFWWSWVSMWVHVHKHKHFFKLSLITWFLFFCFSCLPLILLLPLFIHPLSSLAQWSWCPVSGVWWWTGYWFCPEGSLTFWPEFKCFSGGFWSSTSSRWWPSFLCGFHSKR